MKTSRHAIALLLTPCLLVQCTITPIRPPELGRKGAGEILRRHSINVDGNGVAFKPEGLLSARREGFTESPSDRLWMRRREYETQLDDMFAALDADTRCETVLVFVHGGLVNLNQGTAESIRLTKAIQEDSGGADSSVVRKLGDRAD